MSPKPKKFTDVLAPDSSLKTTKDNGCWELWLWGEDAAETPVCASVSTPVKRKGMVIASAVQGHGH